MPQSAGATTVTFALAVTKRFPWKEVPIYWAAQYVGAIIGAFAIWGVFGANAATFGMGQTHFAPDASFTVYLQAGLAEALGTGLLLFAILGIVDSKSPSQFADQPFRDTNANHPLSGLQRELEDVTIPAQSARAT